MRAEALGGVFTPRLFWVLITHTVVVILNGCTHEASLQRETLQGGLVAFSIQSEADVLSSAGRRDALRVMEEKCPSGVRIIKEGEIPKVSKAADRVWGPQIGTDRKWGIQFECK